MRDIDIYYILQSLNAQHSVAKHITKESYISYLVNRKLLRSVRKGKL